MAPRDPSSLNCYTVKKPESDVHDFYRNFIATTEGKEQSLIKHSEVRRVLQIMEACFESYSKKQRLEVNI